MTDDPAAGSGSILPEGWSWGDVGHGLLDVAGLVPGYGEVADVSNAAWYAAEGRHLEAGLSLISCVPVVGDLIGKGGKLAGKLGGPALKKLVPLLKKMDFAQALAPFRSNKKLGPHIDKMVEALNKWREQLIAKAECKTVCPNVGKASREASEQIAKHGDFATPKDQAVFYSGPGNRDRALHAAQNGGVPIDATPGGTALNGENLYSEFSGFTNKEADTIWAQASEKFAQGASGHVTAFVHGASPDRLFGATELPLLLKNDKVLSINGVPTATLRALESAKPGSAFAAVVAKAPF